MIRMLTRLAAILVLAAGAQGCISTAVGVTGAVVGTTAKVGAKAIGATARAVIPGDSRKDKDRD
jgi:hypothetical protein